MRFDVKILGSNSATPAYGRNQTSQIVNIRDVLYLIDCGEGTQLQMIKYGVKKNKVKYIFISHLHGDHYLGLIGLLSSMHLSGRVEDLYLFGPPPLKEIIDMQFEHSQTFLNFIIHFYPTQGGKREKILETSDVQVFSFPLNHRIPCTGFRFYEKPLLPKIDIKKIEQLALDIPQHYFLRIKNGEDYTTPEGITYGYQELTIAPPPVRSYAYCSDTLYDESYSEAIYRADCLYHEATFSQNMAIRAAETHHSTAAQAAMAAKNAQVEQLLIGHFSARHKTLDTLLEESRAVFPNTYLAIEGKTFSVK